VRAFNSLWGKNFFLKGRGFFSPKEPGKEIFFSKLLKGEGAPGRERGCFSSLELILGL